MRLRLPTLPERDEYVLTYMPARGLPYKIRIALDGLLRNISRPDFDAAREVNSTIAHGCRRMRAVCYPEYPRLPDPQRRRRAPDTARMQVIEAMDGAIVVRLGRIDLVVIEERALLVWAASGLVLRRWAMARC